MRLRLANSAMRRTLRSSSSPINRRTAVAVVELASAARGKHRDDDVGHLRDFETSASASLHAAPRSPACLEPRASASTRRRRSERRSRP